MKRSRKRPVAAAVRAVIDRIEEEVAVLVVDGRELTRPRATLPPEAREGDVLDLDTLQVDAEATEALRRQVREARERALKGSPPPSGDFDL